MHEFQKQFQLLIGQIILFALLISIFQNFTLSAEINVNQQVIEEVACNNNGICEPDLGENNENCSSDCPVTPPPVSIPGQKELDTTPPTNVSNFETIAGDGKIELRWKNPPDSDFKGVKIMRSEKFYPKNPWEGIMVYDGKGTSFLDTGLTNGKRYYYTAFAYDYAGNYSSGAIASAVFQKSLGPEKASPEIIPAPKKIPEITPVPEEMSPLIPVPPEIELFLENFDFIQKGAKVPLKIKAEEKKPLTISIDYEKVSEAVKTIIITLEKDGKSLSFLMRANKEKTKYLTTLIPPEPGVYSLTITFFNQENQVLKKIFSQLEVTPSEIVTPTVEIPWQQKYRIYIYLILILLILAVLIAAGITYFIKKTKNSKAKSQNYN